jgi:peptidoglycan/LPS O-acetylase OafA/YrhL
MPAFLGHLGLGLAAARIRSVSKPWLAVAAAAPLVLFPVLTWIPLKSVVFGFESLEGQVLVRPIAAAGFALVILAGASPGGIRRILELSPLRWLGDISYSLYLAHIPVQIAMDVWVDATANPWAWCVLATLASLAAGTGLYYAVERPAERWRHQRKLRDRIKAQAAPAAGS